MSERDRKDLALTGKIAAIHRRSRGVYGSPNIHAELADDYRIRVDPQARSRRCSIEACAVQRCGATW